MLTVDPHFCNVKLFCSTILASTLIYWSNAYAEIEVGKISNPKEKQYWALSIDNDAFAPRATDYDYTAGAAFTYSGRPNFSYWQSFDNLLKKIDRAIALVPDLQSDSDVAHSIEFGLYGFTPENIELNHVQENDRPFSSLMYLSAGRTYLMHNGNAWSSTLTVGALGLDTLKAVQNRVHKIIGSVKAEGWGNQISKGGELTMRYQTAYHHYWDSNTLNSRFKTSYFGSLGYLTEAGIALSTRQGRISSPDYRFNPELIAYGERVHDAGGHSYRDSENYYWGGFALKLRAYNVFLQGQFRDSKHTLSSGELKPVIAEAWLGYTYSFGREIKLSYVVRAQTSEIRTGNGDRSLVWGGIILSSSI